MPEGRTAAICRAEDDAYDHYRSVPTKGERLDRLDSMEES